MKRPETVNIFGKAYSIAYLDKPSDVDIHGRESLWGQVDYWTHSIRIYAPSNRENGQLWDTLLHEILHTIVSDLNIKLDSEEDVVGLLALGLSDVLLRNDWLPVMENER